MYYRLIIFSSWDSCVFRYITSYYWDFFIQHRSFSPNCGPMVYIGINGVKGSHKSITLNLVKQFHVLLDGIIFIYLRAATRHSNFSLVSCLPHEKFNIDLKMTLVRCSDHYHSRASHLVSWLQNGFTVGLNSRDWSYLHDSQCAMKNMGAFLSNGMIEWITVLWHVEPLLGGDIEANDETTSAAR
jgi:hypothetical protein